MFIPTYNPAVTNMAASQAAVHAQLAAAHAVRLRMRDEEECLTFYTEADLEQGWQFKIVTGNFGSPQAFKAVCAEQARWGWVFVEKFDDLRIRFKRPASEAAKDAERKGDPYMSKSGDAPVGCGPAVLLLAGLGTLAGFWAFG